MKIVFLHSHKFRRIDGEYYSLGALSNEVLKRYTKYADELIVIARVIDEEDTKDNYSKITDEKVIIKNYKELSYKDLVNEIDTANAVIARLPCMISSLGISIAKKLNKKCLAEVVGCAWDSYWNHSLIGKLVAPWMFILTKKAVKNASSVLYVSNKFLQDRYPTKREQIACSDVVLFDFDDSILQKRENKIKNIKDGDKLILGTVGAVNVKYKGQQYVIEALRRLHEEGYDFEYQIVGSGNNEYLKNVAQKNNVLGNVNFVGSLPHDKIFEWLDTIDIYIQPSNCEGLPRALIEAISRACPAIASNAGENSALLQKDYIFKKKNVDELVNKIKSFSKEKMLQQARINFENSHKYDSKILNKKRQKFYDKFILRR